MLKSLDIVIGLTVVLLALSMAVTVITQGITTLINSRGRHLRRGLTDLLQQLDPALTETVSKAVSTAILTHPLVSGSTAPFAATGDDTWLGKLRRMTGGARLGNVVHREEFTKLLMAAATGQPGAQISQEASAALVTALANNGVADPADTLKKVRTFAMQLERSAPELSSVMRQNVAILHAAESDLVAKINNWFDQTMDRTSQRFTASTRAITFAGAFLVAFGLQVDTPALVNRLAADDALRAAFVNEAQALYKDQEELQKAGQRQLAEQAPVAPAAAAPAAEGKPTPPASPAPTTLPAPTTPEEVGRKYRAFLATNGVITLPEQRRMEGGLRQRQPLRHAADGAPPQSRRALLVQRPWQPAAAALGPGDQGRRAAAGAAVDGPARGESAGSDRTANPAGRRPWRPRHTGMNHASRGQCH